VPTATQLRSNATHALTASGVGRVTDEDAAALAKVRSTSRRFARLGSDKFYARRGRVGGARNAG
jgi:hypothetical protein